MVQKVGIVGLGLIGGSLAKALRHRCGVKTIVATNRNEDVLKQALEEGVIDAYSTSITDQFKHCDLVFVCTPVNTIFAFAQELAKYIDKKTILTDVGSTKRHLFAEMKTLDDKITYIGGHPMTGSERFRYSASKEHLFENAYYVLTPNENAEEGQVAIFSAVIEKMGAIPVVVSPKEHDYIVASISHVPHIIASALVNNVKDLDKNGYMHLLAAGGFKDITRIASSSPTMWESICMENKEDILSVLTSLETVIGKIKISLQTENQKEIQNYFETAQVYRDSFFNVTPNSFVKRYEISIDVVDRPGSIAIIAVLFSSNNINIKNMSIINNREQEQGALYFAFDSEEQRQKSIQLLRELNYQVFEKD